jgi:RNA polymerase sigma factor (sigma-70 family)
MQQEDVFQAYKPLLFSIAYNMLGSVMDAEDCVQEAFLRWYQASDNSEAEAVRSPKSYLSTIVTRLSIDHLRSAHVRREQYIGVWLPEPLIITDETSVTGMAELSEALSVAFLHLLEQLSPLERAVFLLRQIFDYDYGEIAAMVQKSENNCRQIVRRARQHLGVHLRILLGLSKFAYRRTCQFQLSHDSPLAESLFHESTYIFIVRDTLVSSDLLLKVVVPHPFRPLIGSRRASSVAFLGLCHPAGAVVFDALRLCWDRIRSVLFDFRQAGLLAIHHLFEPFPQILQQVESIGHLLSLRCAFLGCRCVISTPISADDLHFRMTT